MDITLNLLDKESVDIVKLAGQFSDVIGDCCGEDVSLRTQLMDNFPLVAWLLQTQASTFIRQRMFREKRCGMYKDDGEWLLKVPGSIWSVPQTSAEEECCFVPFEFDKCASEVPLKLLCLKDCESIMDELIGYNLRSATVEGLAYAGETEDEVRRRIARLSFAFYEGYNIMYGHDDTYVVGDGTSVPLKPFHGMAQIMDNPAIASIEGGDIYTGFASVGCRARLIGGDYIIAVNPIIYQSIESVIRPDANGNYPAGWSRGADGRLRYNGYRFIEDRLMPVDFEDGTGEAWVLSGDAVGVYMMDNLFATEGSRFIRRDEKVESVADGCASKCDYYYNLGSAFNNNAAKLMKVVDIPISGACAAGIGDLTGLLTPNTLIPNIG